MSATNMSDDSESELGQNGTTIQEDRPRAVDDSGGESERIRRRLGAAIVIPFASLVILALFVGTVALVLIEAEHLGRLVPSLVAGLVAVVIVVTAWRGRLTHDPGISFGRLMGGILAVGVVLIGLTLWLIRPSSGPPPGTIVVLAREYELVAESWSAPEGEVVFSYESGGQIGHTLTIEGREGQMLLKVSPSSPMDSGSIQLQEGVYTVYCDLRGHRDLGMEATLEVTESLGATGESHES
jgi:hypothetical protein